MTSDTLSDTETGWTAGAGAEYAFTDNLTARVEYRYADFGDLTNTHLHRWISDDARFDSSCVDYCRNVDKFGIGSRCRRENLSPRHLA
ncbi:outer membrane protein [Mesorhizobium sp. BHbsci]